ncbi:monooxygenase [Streptomyces sp. WAC07149]|nr:monooxygenase [Streptomyces sp. WAC07149]
MDPHPGDAGSALWTLECTARRDAAGLDLTGPWIQGRPGQRFVYLTWNGVDGTGVRGMFRRAKLMLDAVDPAAAAAAADTGLLVARLALTDAHGRPLCAAVRPPAVTWSAGVHGKDPVTGTL